MTKDDKYFLKVYRDKSELVRGDKAETFVEGDMSEQAKNRYRLLQEKLEEGYLDDLINSLMENAGSGSVYDLDERHQHLLSGMVDSVTSEVGRAIVALSIMQLVVKAIEPKQNVRLHKGGGGRRNFSWQEGISMRSLDKRYITPTLRKHDLMRLNADGFMMTRSLAENYPYSIVYKAKIRGARKEWVELVETIETGALDPVEGLKYMLSLLINKAGDFKKLASETVKLLDKFISKREFDKKDVFDFIEEHIEKSDYAARLMEISMHSLMQALYELKVFLSYELKPLSQMRSANKKHGNIGDIELLDDSELVESWDGKYGKRYLRDEIEELADKLKIHDSVQIAGFVTDGKPDRLDEMSGRVSEIEELHNIKVIIQSYREWVNDQYSRASKEVGASEDEISKRWLKAYVESIAQKRREIAPIDEPCHSWLSSLKEHLKSKVK